MAIEDQIEQDAVSCCSDAGSVIGESSNSERRVAAAAGGVLKLDDESEEFIMLKHRFYVTIGPLSENCTVVGASKNLHSSPMQKAQMEAFKAFMEAVKAKRGGDPNMVHAWFVGSKEQVEAIIKDGFRVAGVGNYDGQYGFGLKLYPERLSRECVMAAPADGDGLKHQLVCRVVLGNTEVVLPGSTQSGPTSPNFDTGVDHGTTPTKYIIWYPDVKTNILPLYALTLKLDPQATGAQRAPAAQPTSPWIPFTPLLYILSRYLPEESLCRIRKYHTDFIERKITREQFIFSVRYFTGDKLLVAAVRHFYGNGRMRRRGNGRIPRK